MYVNVSTIRKIEVYQTNNFASSSQNRKGPLRFVLVIHYNNVASSDDFSFQDVELRDQLLKKLVDGTSQFVWIET